jgi:hypothetical protein
MSRPQRPLGEFLHQGCTDAHGHGADHLRAESGPHHIFKAEFFNTIGQKETSALPAVRRPELCLRNLQQSR